MSFHIRYRPSYGVAAALFAGACGIADEPLVDVTDDQELHGPAPSPGAAGIGDVLFPTLGNGGYEVDHYHLDLRYATAAPSQAIDGTVTIAARATQALSRFNLDFAGASVGAVTVDGCAAAFLRDGEELVITPAQPIKRNESFVVTVSHFVANPEAVDPNEFLDAPFFITPDGSAWANQPHNAHRIFPSNDHPRDKATFSFRLDVPAGTTAVASGALIAQHTANGRSVSYYVQPEPMATELAQVAVGAFSVISRGTQDGVVVRDVVPARLAADLEPKLAGVTAHLDFMTEQVGDYPFRSYGSLVADAPLGFALETQTLSVYDLRFFDFPAPFYEPIMVHELAHQWFGDSVAPRSWSDVWQNEGHATWYELTFQIDPDSPEFVELAQIIYSLGNIWRAEFGPVAAPLSGDPVMLFNPNVYYGGALVLYVLREQIGDAKFRQLQRAWVTKYRGKSPSTDDFIALASQVSGQNLKPLLEAWLYGTTIPAMPGHPDWVPDPVPPAPLQAKTATGAPQVPMKGLRLLRH